MHRRTFLKGAVAAAVLSQVPGVLATESEQATRLVLPEAVMRHGWEFNPKTGLFSNTQLKTILIERSWYLRHAFKKQFRRDSVRMEPAKEYGVLTEYKGKLSAPPEGVYERLLPLIYWTMKNRREGLLRVAATETGYVGAAWYVPKVNQVQEVSA